MLRLLLSDQVSQTASLACDCAFGTVFVLSIVWMLMRNRKTHRAKTDAKGWFVMPKLPDIALTVKSWEVNLAIPKIVEYLKSTGIRVCVVRKRGCLDKFIEAAQAYGNFEIAEILTTIQKSHRAIITPVNDGEEDWRQVKVIAVESDTDDLIDGFMVADTGRVAKL